MFGVQVDGYITGARDTDHEEHTMDEYEVTITAAREEYVYVIVADAEGQAQGEAEDTARDAGWSGFGHVAVRSLS